MMEWSYKKGGETGRMRALQRSSTSASAARVKMNHTTHD